MQGKDHSIENAPLAVQELIRGIVSAIRAVRLYPPNNPVYAQTIARSHKLIEGYLRASPEFRVTVHKTGLLYNQILVDRDAQLSKSISDDLYAKGVREITITCGLSEQELRDGYSVLALSQEEVKQKGSTASLLWERGVAHMKVKEASLDEIVRGEDAGHGAPAARGDHGASVVNLQELLKGKEIDLHGRKVTLSYISDDPAGFGQAALEMAREAGETRELQEGRLLDIYRETGRQMLQRAYEQREPLFDALARSLFSLDPSFRDNLVSKRLYPELDRQSLQVHIQEGHHDEVPDDLHEIISARFSRSWTVPQVSTLLQKAASAGAADLTGSFGSTPIPVELAEMARELSEYTPEEMETLRMLGEAGGERDALQAATATLINLLPAAQSPLQPSEQENALSTLSGIVGLLEDLLTALLDKKDYRSAAAVLRTFRMTVAPPFRSRMAEALRRAGGAKRITALVRTLRSLPKNSLDYQALSACLSLLDREATPVLLEMLAEEEDRSVRKVLIQILKDLGKNQVALLGERLSDERWYFVRNIVNILGESRKEEVVSYLEKVAGHKNFQIRQEVVRALIAIGGKRAADLLSTCLRDKDIDIRFMAIRGLGTINVPGGRGEQELVSFLRKGWWKRTDPQLKEEAVISLGKIGGEGALRFLRPLGRVKWWKSRKPQEMVRDAAVKAIQEIERRTGRAR
jgi:HEAT repeat protein